MVCFTTKGVLVGQEALDDPTCQRQYLIYECKRLIGLSAEHDAVRSQKSKVRYQFSEIKGDTDGCPVQGVKVAGLCHCYNSLHAYYAQAMPIQRVCIFLLERSHNKDLFFYVWSCNQGNKTAGCIRVARETFALKK